LMIYWLAMSNSMYNPMIYCYMNQRFRKGFTKVFNFILWWRRGNSLSNSKFKRVEVSKAKDSKNHLKVPNGHMAQNGSAKHYLSTQSLMKEESPDISQKSYEARNPYSPSNSPSDQMSNQSAYYSKQPTPALKKHASNFININKFLKKARGNYVKVDKLQVRVCESSSDNVLLETSLCSEKVERKNSKYKSSNHFEQCDKLGQCCDNHPAVLTCEKSSEVSDYLKSVEKLPQLELSLRPSCENRSFDKDLNLPEAIGRIEKLV